MKMASFIALLMIGLLCIVGASMAAPKGLLEGLFGLYYVPTTKKTTTTEKPTTTTTTTTGKTTTTVTGPYGDCYYNCYNNFKCGDRSINGCLTYQCYIDCTDNKTKFCIELCGTTTTASTTEATTTTTGITKSEGTTTTIEGTTTTTEGTTSTTEGTTSTTEGTCQTEDTATTEGTTTTTGTATNEGTSTTEVTTSTVTGHDDKCYIDCMKSYNDREYCLPNCYTYEERTCYYICLKTIVHYVPSYCAEKCRSTTTESTTVGTTTTEGKTTTTEGTTTEGTTTTESAAQCYSECMRQQYHYDCAKKCFNITVTTTEGVTTTTGVTTPGSDCYDECVNINGSPVYCKAFCEKTTTTQPTTTITGPADQCYIECMKPRPLIILLKYIANPEYCLAQCFTTTSVTTTEGPTTTPTRETTTTKGTTTTGTTTMNSTSKCYEKCIKGYYTPAECCVKCPEEPNCQKTTTTAKNIF